MLWICKDQAEMSTVGASKVKYRSLKNVWKFKWGQPCPGFISHGWENPSSFTQNGSSLWSHLYNSLLATHVSWDQANKKGNCGMDEEEVEMEAEKELKGNGRAKGYGSPSDSDSEAL